MAILTDKQLEIVSMAISHYGCFAQRMKAIEELGECSAAIARNIGDMSCKPVVTEVADTLIMMSSVIVMGDIAEHVNQEVAFKIARLEGRINSDKKRQKQLEELHG